MKRSAAVVALCPRGKVLVLRRGPTDPWAPGMWCLPGGGAEPHETLEQAARREAFEEAGLLLGPLRPLMRVRTPHGFVQVFIGHSTDGRALLLDGEHDQMAWLAPHELSSVELLPYARAVAKRLTDAQTLSR